LAYGYAASGQRAFDQNRLSKGKRVSAIGALGLNGMVASMTFEGTLNSNLFLYFIEHFLKPHLDQETVLILDNASPHKTQKVRELLEETGAIVLFLPPYCPDMNPIEYVWARAKQIFREKKPRTIEELYDTWEEALKLIDEHLAKRCFQHCGLYNPNLN